MGNPGKPVAAQRKKNDHGDDKTRGGDERAREAQDASQQDRAKGKILLKVA